MATVQLGSATHIPQQSSLFAVARSQPSTPAGRTVPWPWQHRKTGTPISHAWGTDTAWSIRAQPRREAVKLNPKPRPPNPIRPNVNVQFPGGGAGPGGAGAGAGFFPQRDSVATLSETETVQASKAAVIVSRVPA